MIAAKTVAQGSLLEVARLAGIQAATQPSTLIPLCHNLALDFVNADVWLEGRHVRLLVDILFQNRLLGPLVRELQRPERAVQQLVLVERADPPEELAVLILGGSRGGEVP